MKSVLCSLVLLGVTVTLLVGCSRAPVRAKIEDANDATKGNKEPRQTKAFARFLDTVRYTENPRAGDDWTRFRSGLELLSGHFSKPEVARSVRDLSAKNRAFLETVVGLTEMELAEVESTSFRTADAHYLDECFLLHDVTRSLEVNDPDPMKQAEQHFRWVMRNVILHEQTDSWIPPAFTLRRGHGGALERALVFLALLRQAQIDGCLIMLPDAEPNQCLVAVLDATSENRALASLAASTVGIGNSSLFAAAALIPDRAAPSLLLFDPRLGLPLKSKDRRSILTLKDALNDPVLLQPAQITPAQAKKLEARLVCPLYSLSPRLFELQTQLGKLDTCTLHLDAQDLFAQISRATSLPVKVWNPPPTKAQWLPVSPTRCLWMFLPKQDGGIDATAFRAAAANRIRGPFNAAMLTYAQLNLKALLPKDDFQRLQSITNDLLNKYDMQTREMFLRGLNESVSRRYERLQPFVGDSSMAGLLRDREFRKEAEEWASKVDKANTLALDRNPEMQAKARQAAQSLWYQDPFVNWMIELNKEEKFDREQKKTVLARILAAGLRDYLEYEMARTKAAGQQENAERAAALVATLRAQQKPTETALERAREAWGQAKTAWGNSYLDQVSLASTIKRRLEQVQQLPPNEFEYRILLLEMLHLDVQKYFQARLRLAECLEYLQGKKASDKYLRHTKAEIEAMEKTGLLNAEVNKLLDNSRQFPPAQLRLNLLSRDWTAQGHYYWLKQHIDQKTGN